jgi:two-component system sensor histidine kinase YesM
MLLVLPTIIIGVFINNVYMDTLIENSSQTLMQALRQITIGVNNELTRISLTASTISNDDGLMNLSKRWHNTSDIGEKLELSDEINAKLNFIFNNSGQVETIIFFFKDNGLYNYKNEPIISEQDIKEMDWYREILKNRGNVKIMETLKSFTYNSMHQYVISACFSPDTHEAGSVEAIYFAFRLDNLESFYSGIKIANKGKMLIVDNRNQILASSDSSIIGKNISDIGFTNGIIQKGAHVVNLDGQKALVSSDTISKTKWKVVNITKYEDLSEGVQKATRIVVLVILLMLLLFFVFSLMFFREIILPINNLMKKMKNVEKGNFDETIEVKRNDELYQLGESFNRMVRQIKRLITERDLKERQRHQAEIEVLQSQINPHFLSNTLNSIRLMSMIAKIDSIKNMSDALIKLLQASFAKKGKLITIEEELSNLDSYLYIMKVRFGDRFDILMVVDEDIKDFYVLRLVLQPIVENSILHGISELEKKGEIIIKGYKKEQSIIFEIQDNGIGMSEEQISRLLSGDYPNSKGFSSIGIKNVDQRIKLNHGQAFGLQIASEIGEYTRITIELPVMHKKEGEIVCV